MPSGFHTWSQTAANNGNADSGINWAEGMAPSAVNDSGRSMMAVQAKWRDDISGTLTTGGTSTSYTLTTNTVFTSTSLLSGQSLTVKFDKTSGTSPTLNVDGLGAAAITTVGSTAIPFGMIQANSIWRVTYDSTTPSFVVHNVAGSIPLANLQVSSASSTALAATDDLLPLFDSSAGSNAQISVANFFKVLDLLAVESLPESTDEIMVYDVSASTTDKMTFANAFKAINQLAEDTSPSSNSDYVATYDSSAAAAKKATPTNLVNAAAGAAKAWANITTSGSVIATGFNVSSTVKNGTGDYTVTFSTAFTTSNYVVTATPESAADHVMAYVFAKTASTARIKMVNIAGTLQDLNLNITAFGVQ